MVKYINKYILFFLAFTLFSCDQKQEKVGQYVDPNIGGVAPLLTTVTPQVHRPHSMVRIYPITKGGLTDRYFSDRIYGITFNMPRYRSGEVTSIMATSGTIKTNMDSSSSWYDHGIEELHPWFHKVYLDDFDIDAQWTTTERTSIFNFTFNKNAGESSNLLIRVRNNGEVTIIDNKIISGYESVGYAKQYFYVVTGKPFSQSGVWSEDALLDEKSVTGKNIGAWISSDNTENIEVRVGISYISVAQAKINLEKENLGKTFSQIKDESEQIWENALGKIKVKGGTLREKRIFYTSLYRTYERMINQTESDSYYSGFDRNVHPDERPFYNDDWAWDTYRNSHALGMILNPDMKADHLQSYVRMYEQAGWVPNFPGLIEGPDKPRGLKEEPMIGNHTASIFAEALTKGIDNFDVEKAYEGVKKNALEGSMVPWRFGPATELDIFYNENGYFPGLAPGEKEIYDYVDDSWEKRQSVSVTLEHSYDDWCIAQIAKRLGKEDDYNLFMKRSRFYMNLWNPEIRYFAPKNIKGEWITPFDPELCDGYGARSYFAEVNACVHLFHVQHDIPNLIEIMGGDKKFIERLDEMYNRAPKIGKWRFMGRMPDATGLQGMIPAGNEPAFHIPFLYNYANAPWKTQHRVRQICDVWFDDSPSGLSGDEDGGALTAWYVFAAMGFYPVNPASGEYALSSPIFSNVEISLPNGKIFTIKAPEASEENKYIQFAKLNGEPLNKPFISHENIMGGAILEFEMGRKPNKLWGVK